MAAQDCQKNSLSRQRTVLGQIALDIAEALYSFWKRLQIVRLATKVAFYEKASEYSTIVHILVSRSKLDYSASLIGICVNSQTDSGSCAALSFQSR